MPRAKTNKIKASPGLKIIRRTKGLSSTIAARLCISRQAVAGWPAVPLSRLADVEAITGIDREQLRPDLFRRSRKKRARR